MITLQPTKYYSDGFLGSKNPSNKGGYTIVNQENVLVLQEKIFKQHLTVNEVELLGVYNALKIADNDDVISTDSQNTLKWINNINKKKRKKVRIDLDPIKLECYNLMISKKIKLIWERRDKNLAGIWNEENIIDFDDLDLSWIV